MVNFYSDIGLQQQHDKVFQTCISDVETLPPGIDQKTFGQIIAQLRSIVGEDNVVTGSELNNFRDPYPLIEEEFQASAAACPASVDEIQSILKIANTFSLPLWTCSRGKNLGYGGPAPRLSGSVVLSLHRMNSIIEVSEKFNYVVVEPGVTFFDINKYFKEHNLNLWCSTPALGWGSVIGNTLDRGHGYTTSGDRQHFIGSMEVVLPNGELLRTGQWAVTDSPSTHCCSNNFGPQIDGLFLQSNLGIVTKLAVTVDPAPSTYMGLIFNAPEESDMEPLLEVIHKLFREGILQNHVIINNINHYASHDSRKHVNQTEPGALTPETIDRLKKKYNTGYWRGLFDLYGTKAMVLARAARVEEVFSIEAPGVRLDKRFLEGENGKPLDNSVISTLGAGSPSMRAVALADYNLAQDGTGAGAHIDTTLILPTDGKLVLEWFKKARGIMENQGVDPFIGCHIFGNHILFVQTYVYDKTQPTQRQRGVKVVDSLMAEAKVARFANYRSHLHYMDAIQDLYDYNGHAYKRFIENIKSTIDPHGILSPGKQGIWQSKTPGPVVASKMDLPLRSVNPSV